MPKNCFTRKRCEFVDVKVRVVCVCVYNALPAEGRATTGRADVPVPMAAAAATNKRKKKASEEEVEDEAEEEEAPSRGGVKVASREKTGPSATQQTACPYLDTIAAANLDFDFERKCSVSLSPVHVYACLVCGKYFSGRGKNTHAYKHALENGHHVFMHLETGATYCLPDGYEVSSDASATLRRIRDVLKPETYMANNTEYCVDAVESAPMWRRALDGSEFLVGVTGLNGTAHKGERDSDGICAVLQSLSRVTPLRRRLLLMSEEESSSSESSSLSSSSSIWQHLSHLTKKMWNERNFKGHSSPHEFVQAVRTRSKDAFGTGIGGDAAHFLRWLLNELIREDKKKKKKTKVDPGDDDVIESMFQGELEIITGDDDGNNVSTQTQKFLMLHMELPNVPLFQDARSEAQVIPQVSLERSLLKRFDAATPDPKTRRRFRITKLPDYLVISYSRFVKNSFFTEKNPTIVTFPVRGLNVADHVPVPQGEAATYDLVANVVHDGPSIEDESSSYRAMVYHAPDKNWYETQDLRVEEVLPQQVNLTETYVQIYERRRP